MPWRPLDEFRDPGVPKLFHLRRAARAGLAIPSPTAWAWAEDLGRAGRVEAPAGMAWPCIVRSGSPTEDTSTTSNAGKFLSLVARGPEAFAATVARVVAALPRDPRGRRRGAVFVQPWVEAEEAGVSFFDGFYFETTAAAGSNRDLTAGRARGRVRRGHLRRGAAWDDWLGRVHRVVGGSIDIEWARPAGAAEPVLLQVRPALFPIRRNPVLSLANHKEILGEVPSPWMTGVLVEVGQPVLEQARRADPTVPGRDDPYAVELAGRAWMNFSALFRLMDHWGLPRTMVTEGLGGQAGDPPDDRIRPARFLRKLPRLAAMGVVHLATIAGIRRRLRQLDRALDEARTLAELQRANVGAMAYSIRANFAIMSVLAVVSRLRRALGWTRSARIVTFDMMTEYAALSALPDPDARLAGLDAWLARYGHRGPFESDPMRPRFAELRPALVADVLRGASGIRDSGRGGEELGIETPSPDLPPSAGSSEDRSGFRASNLVRLLFFWPDQVREWFRDRLMRWWGRLRERALAEGRDAVAAGWLDDPEDVFFLRSDDLAADPATWRSRAAARRAGWDHARTLDLPTTAPRDRLEAIAARAGRATRCPRADRFEGIGLGGEPVTGTAVRAVNLPALLARDLPGRPILIAETLEPSWAVVFPRFAAVVAELGGELSHAAILLREAGIPAVVNARGVGRQVGDGDTVRVDPTCGEVRIEDRGPKVAPVYRVEAVTIGATEILNKAC